VSVASADNVNRVDDAIALWDTGATVCFISRGMAERLRLKKIGESDVGFANGAVERKDVFSIRLTFQPSGREIHLHVRQTDEDSQDIIIGMDVIRNGTFMLKPTGDGVCFTFTV